MLQADQHRKIQLKFVVKDKKGGVALTVHQAFVALVHVESQREVIYVAESDKTTKAYTFDLVSYSSLLTTLYYVVNEAIRKNRIILLPF